MARPEGSFSLTLKRKNLSRLAAADRRLRSFAIDEGAHDQL
jgi:hypothetical protein